MLKVYVHNFGDHPKAPRRGNYGVVVAVNDEDVAHGHVMNYDRRKGWRGLLRAVAASKDMRDLGESKE